MRIFGLHIVRESSAVKAAEQMFGPVCSTCGSYRCPECFQLVLFAGDHNPACGRYQHFSVNPG